MRLLTDGDSKHIYLTGRWLSVLIYVFHSFTHRLFQTRSRMALRTVGCALTLPHASGRVEAHRWWWPKGTGLHQRGAPVCCGLSAPGPWSRRDAPQIREDDPLKKLDLTQSPPGSARGPARGQHRPSRLLGVRWQLPAQARITSSFLQWWSLHFPDQQVLRVWSKDFSSYKDF